MKYSWRKNSGFTLWELLLVIAIIGVITLIAVPRYLNTSEYVREEVNKANILKLEESARLYYLDVASFPKSMEDLLEQPNHIEGWRGPYLDERLDCPFGDINYVFTHQGRVILR